MPTRQAAEPTINVRIAKSLYKRLSTQAKIEERTITAALARAIRAYVEKESGR